MDYGKTADILAKQLITFAHKSIPNGKK